MIYFTHTVVFTISEWIRATPLTACEPTTQRCAMLILFGSPSSIRDILRNRSTSSGYSAEILYNRVRFNKQTLIKCCGYLHLVNVQMSLHPDVACWSHRLSAGGVVEAFQTCKQANAPEPRVTLCGLCTHMSLWWSPMPTQKH